MFLDINAEKKITGEILTRLIPLSSGRGGNKKLVTVVLREGLVNSSLFMS